MAYEILRAPKSQMFLFFFPLLLSSLYGVSTSYLQIEVTQNAKFGVIDVTLKNEKRKTTDFQFLNLQNQWFHL